MGDLSAPRLEWATHGAPRSRLGAGSGTGLTPLSATTLVSRFNPAETPGTDQPPPAGVGRPRRLGHHHPPRLPANGVRLRWLVAHGGCRADEVIEVEGWDGFINPDWPEWRAEPSRRVVGWRRSVDYQGRAVSEAARRPPPHSLIGSSASLRAVCSTFQTRPFWAVGAPRLGVSGTHQAAAGRVPPQRSSIRISACQDAPRRFSRSLSSPRRPCGHVQTSITGVIRTKSGWTPVLPEGWGSSSTRHSARTTARRVSRSKPSQACRRSGRRPRRTGPWTGWRRPGHRRARRSGPAGCASPRAAAPGSRRPGRSPPPPPPAAAAAAAHPTSHAGARIHDLSQIAYPSRTSRLRRLLLVRNRSAESPQNVRRRPTRLNACKR